MTADANGWQDQPEQEREELDVFERERRRAMKAAARAARLNEVEALCA